MDNPPQPRLRVILQAPGFNATWFDTPERIQRLLQFAVECIVEAQNETQHDTNQDKKSPMPCPSAGQENRTL
jgi:hypothetical protein